MGIYTGGCRDNHINVLKPQSKLIKAFKVFILHFTCVVHTFEKRKFLKVASGL